MTEFDPDLLEMLACPETKEPVHVAEAGLIAKLNEAQKAGLLKNRAGKTVEQPLQEGFIREDKAYLYPVIDGIPVMLIDEAIPLEGFA
jgi:uncharacterized protein YbaR (Trm112 family)